MTVLDAILLCLLLLSLAAFANESRLRAKAEAALVEGLNAAHANAMAMLKDERDRAELLFMSKSVGEYIQARRVSKLPTHIEAVRTTMPLSDAELAKMEKNGAFATGGAAVEAGR